MPIGSMCCAYCGTKLPHSAGVTSTGRMTCTRCGKFMPFRGKLEKRTMCVECENRYNQELAAERDREEQRKAMVVSQIIARHPELRGKILYRVGLREFSGRFYVDHGAFQDICSWDRCVTHAKNLETARRYEDAARAYESVELWQEAGRVRDKKSARTVKHVTVNLNDLIERLRTGGLSVPYKCTGCGATITVGKDTNPEALKFCSYCGSAMNIETLARVLQDALR